MFVRKSEVAGSPFQCPCWCQVGPWWPFRALWKLSGLLPVQCADQVKTAEAASGTTWLGSQTAPQVSSPSVPYLKDIHYILHVLGQSSTSIQVNEYKQYHKICFEGDSLVHALLLSSYSTHENKSR